MPASSRPVVCVALALVAACSAESSQGAPANVEATADATEIGIVVVDEIFQTVRDTLLNIDSPAVWHGPEGQHWLLTTAKEGDLVRVESATTGEFLRDIGGPGSALGQFERPNGIAVVDNHVWVVERDNGRVQLLTLPDFRPVGVFGAEDLVLPYGIAIAPQDNDYRVFVTDNYEIVPDQIPPDSALGRRVREFQVALHEDTLAARLVRTFGDTSGPGVLRVVESIFVDASSNRLMIAEELEGESTYKAYDLDGRFVQTAFDTTFFPHQAEGIVLYRCDSDDGYWITTDQGTDVNTFHIFHRGDLSPAGSFRGRSVRNTDGIALTQSAFPGFPSGAFYAVHNDGNVAAFSWADIAEGLALRSDCTGN